MTIPPASRDTIAARRAQAAALSRDGASLRTIADRLGVSKDTIRRDLATASRDDSVTVALTSDMRHDLSLLARAGLTDPERAIRWALDHAAATVHQQWSDTGTCPDLTQQPQED